MDKKITATELAKSLSDILNRVRYRRERFIVERNGEPIATIAPAGLAAGDLSLGEFFDLLQRLLRPDDEFADDLAEVQASQQKMTVPPTWPT